MRAHLHEVAVMLLQAAPQGAPLRIFAAMGLVAAGCICIFVLRHLTRRSRRSAAPSSDASQRGPSNTVVLTLAVAALLLLGILMFVVMRG